MQLRGDGVAIDPFSQSAKDAGMYGNGARGGGCGGFQRAGKRMAKGGYISREDACSAHVETCENLEENWLRVQGGGGGGGGQGPGGV